MLKIYFENETGSETFDLEKKAYEVIGKALETEGCPFPVEVSLTITDGSGIRNRNNKDRGIDEETDVLSYPAIEFQEPSGFNDIDENDPPLFNLDETPPRLILGDILVNMDRIISQAKELGHSEEYEYAFMLAHSALHLLGWDHAEPSEEERMTEETKRIVT